MTVPQVDQPIGDEALVTPDHRQRDVVEAAAVAAQRHPVHPYRGLDRDAARRREDRALMLKIGVAGAAAGNIMLLAIALYAGLFGGMGSRDAAFFRWTSMIVALPALSFAAMPFFRGAVGALRSGRRRSTRAATTRSWWPRRCRG